MIEALFLPSASPHQPTPSCCGVLASPDWIQLMYVWTAVRFFDVFTIAFVFVAFRNPPPFWYGSRLISFTLIDGFRFSKAVIVARTPLSSTGEELQCASVIVVVFVAV